MRYYGEEGVEFDHKRVLGLKSNSQRLLRNELWRGQQRGGASLPAHARQIATRCSTVPSAPMTRADHRRPSELSRGKDVVFYVSCPGCFHRSLLFPCFTLFLTPHNRCRSYTGR